MNKRALIGFSVIACSILSGCATGPQDQYYWGQYESLINDMYVNAGQATPVVQIEKITQDIQQAENQGKPVPPGVYAHLGFMYSLEGNVGAATEAFNEEKSLYKDSQILIDGMLERANKASNKQ
jgi:hypothetical protein